MIQREAGRSSRRFPALLIRMLLAFAAALVVPLGLPASAHADTGSDKVTVGVFTNDLHAGRLQIPGVALPGRVQQED